MTLHRRFLNMAQPGGQALSAADLAAIVERDVPGFTVLQVPGAVTAAADAGPGAAGGDATIAVKIQPRSATDAPTPFPRGRTVLIDTQ
jgi:hypothetical protein